MSRGSTYLIFYPLTIIFGEIFYFYFWQHIKKIVMKIVFGLAFKPNIRNDDQVTLKTIIQKKRKA